MFGVRNFDQFHFATRQEVREFARVRRRHIRVQKSLKNDDGTTWIKWFASQQMLPSVLDQLPCNRVWRAVGRRLLVAPRSR